MTSDRAPVEGDGQAASSLLPCPLCAAQPETLLRGFYYVHDKQQENPIKADAVMCPACDCRAPAGSWNNRPVPAPVGLEREALEKIAFNNEVNSLHSDPDKNPRMIARATLSSTDGRSSAGQSETAGWNATQRELEILKLREELGAFRKAERSLSEAYVRLRALIPGAFDTPYAPEPEQIWEITENALKAALAPHCPVESLPTRQLVEFFKWAMREGPWDGSDLDGGSVQDKAESLGLIVKTKFDPEKHDGPDWAFSPGDDYYEFAPALRIPAACEPDPSAVASTERSHG